MKLRLRHMLLLLIAAGGTLVSGEEASKNRDAVSRAARRYRLQVYETYRQDRREYDHRINAGERVWSQWEASGAKPDDVRVVAAWYRSAAAASRIYRQPLPKLPILGSLTDSFQAPRSFRPQISHDDQRDVVDVPDPVRSGSQSKHASSGHATSQDVDPNTVESIHDWPQEALIEASGAGDSRSTPDLTTETEAAVSPDSLLRAPANGELGLAEPEPIVRDDSAISFDLELLASRVEAYNADARYFESQLQEQDQWSADELSSFVTQLRDAQEHGELTSIYLDLLPLTVRDRVGQLSSLEPVHAILEQRILEARKRAVKLDGEARQREVRDIKQMSERLKQ